MAVLGTRTLVGYVGTPFALNTDASRILWTGQASPAATINQVWLGNPTNGPLSLVSAALDGTTPGNLESSHAVLSPDGRWVAFASRATNLVAGSMMPTQDIFLRDLQRNESLRVSRTGTGRGGTGFSTQPLFSADSRTVFFLSHATDLVDGDRNESMDVFKVQILDNGSGPLLVLQRDHAAGKARLLWTPTPGKAYRVDFTDDFNAGPWQTLPGNPDPSGSVDLDVTSAANRFFRVVELP